MQDRPSNPAGAIEYSPTFPAPSPDAPGPAPRTNGKATASLVLGILSFLLPFILSSVAIVLGFSARREIKQAEAQKGDGNALAGITLGFVSMALVIAFFAMIVIEELVL